MWLRVMNETYKRFLTLVSRRYPERKIGRKPDYWEGGEQEDPSGLSGSTGILEFMYLKRGAEDTVVMDKRVVAMLQERLKNLEEENRRLRGKVRTIKLLLAGSAALIVALVLMSVLSPTLL